MTARDYISVTLMTAHNAGDTHHILLIAGVPESVDWVRRLMSAEQYKVDTEPASRGSTVHAKAAEAYWDAI